MISSLLRNQSKIRLQTPIHLLSTHPKTLTLITTPTLPFSTTSRRRRRSRSSDAPPPFSDSDLSHALSLLPSRPSPSDLTSALSRLSHNPHLALHLFHHALHLPRFRPDPSSFLLAIKILGSHRLFPQFDSLASLALSSLPPSPHPLFPTILYFYSQARMLSKAIRTYKLMLSSPDPAARPSLSTYNLLFSALLGRGANSYIHHLYMDTLRSLFRQMLDSGVAPDVVALNFMVRGYVQSLHVNDALRIFHQMKPLYGCEPDAVTYSYLVHGLCAQGRTRNARELFEEMRRKGLVLSRRAWNSLASAMAMAGELEGAVGVVWEMVGKGRGVEGITCRAVVEGFCREGRVVEAVGLVGEWREKEVVDGRGCRELMNWIQDEFGGSQLEEKFNLR